MNARALPRAVKRLLNSRSGVAATEFAVALPFMGVGIVLGNRMHAMLNQQGFSRLVGILFVVIGSFLVLR